MFHALPIRGQIFIMLILGIALLVITFVNLNLGSSGITSLDMLRSLAGQGTERSDLVVFQFRMPRILVALLVGTGLALSGAVLQGIARNGLADPGLLGINSGASLATVSYLYFTSGTAITEFQEAFSYALPVAGFVGGLLTAVLVFALARKRGVITPSRIILTGIAVGFGLGALQLILSLKLNPELLQYAATRIAGSLVYVGWPHVTALAVSLVALVPLTLHKAQALNILNLGDAVATGLGVNVERDRRQLIGAAAGLASVCVAVGGGISFVGLIGPHMARRLVGPRH